MLSKIFKEYNMSHLKPECGFYSNGILCTLLYLLSVKIAGPEQQLQKLSKAHAGYFGQKENASSHTYSTVKSISNTCAAYEWDQAVSFVWFSLFL